MAEYLAQFVDPTAASVIAALVHCGLLLAVVVAAGAVFDWLERKVSARLQGRLGPTRVGGRFGWLQSAADGIKLLTKEDAIPGGADATLFRLAPYVSFAAVFGVYLALPFADGWVARRLNVAVFFILAVAGLKVFGVILAGYASGSKWSRFGAMREAAQVVGCKIPLALCVVVPVMIAGTMDLVAIGNMQRGWFTHWFLFHDPFAFLAFFVYLASAVAGVHQAPFDLAEAEGEPAAGFLAEYSGFRWAVFLIAECAAMAAASGLAAILFLGGWNGPLPLAAWLRLTPESGPLAGWLGNLLGTGNFLLKCLAGVVFVMWIRGTLPRLRIDQVMNTCLKYCVPLAAAMLLGAMLWTYALPGGLLPGGTPLGEVPEGSAAVGISERAGR